MIASVAAATMQGSFFALLVWAGKGSTHIVEQPPPPPLEIPIAVQPLLDDRPLLKLGSDKAKEEQRLPEMWQKRAAAPVKRYEERSAPSADAPDDSSEIPSSPLADRDHAAPRPDDEIAERVDQTREDLEESTEDSELEGEGSPDGFEEGTETDPLKARSVDLYRRKILGWFNARFRPDRLEGRIPCEELRRLSTGVTVQVGADRSIAGFAVSSRSGNPTFDAEVERQMHALRGQQLPPPPPLYPDILGSAVFPRLSGAGVSCAAKLPPPKPAPSPVPAPSDNAPTAPEEPPTADPGPPETPPTEPEPTEHEPTEPEPTEPEPPARQEPPPPPEPSPGNGPAPAPVPVE